MSKSMVIKNLEDLRKWVEALASTLSKKQIVLLNGPMAAGKTQTVQFLVEALGGKYVSSPTFAIHQSYKTSRGTVDHIDLFRLKNEADLESTGFWDLFSKTSGLILVEWADRLPEDWIPKDWDVLSIDLQPIDGAPNARKILVSGPTYIRSGRSKKS